MTLQIKLSAKANPKSYILYVPFIQFKKNKNGRVEKYGREMGITVIKGQQGFL